MRLQSGTITVKYLLSLPLIDLRLLTSTLFMTGYLIVGIFLIFQSLRVIMKGYRPASYFPVSVILFFATTLVYFVDILGFFSFSELILFLTSVGAFVVSVFLTLGISRIITFNAAKKLEAEELFQNNLALHKEIDLRLKAENELRTNQNEMKELHEKQSLRLMGKENHFKYLVENLSDWVWQINTKKKFTHNNYKLLNLLGYCEEELFDQPIVQIIEPRDRSLFDEAISLCLTEGKGFIDLPIVLNAKNQKLIPMEVSGEVIRDDNYNIVGLLGISRDLRPKHLSEQTLLKAIHDAEENERKRFASDIHDGIGPILSGINLYLGAWRFSHAAPEKQDELIVKAKQSILEASHELRQISNNLMPVEFINRTLVENIALLIKRLILPHKIEYSFEHKEFHTVLSNDQNLVIYHILSELVNNTLKHAQAQKICIGLNNDDQFVSVSYSDDGIGFEVDKQLIHSDGNGFRIMQSRLRSIDADYHFYRPEEKGMIFHFSFPIFNVPDLQSN